MGETSVTDESLDELEELAKTAGAVTVGRLIQNREMIHPGTYLGKGKLEELAFLISETHATGIICDDELSPDVYKRQIYHMDQNIGVLRLLQCTSECIYQMMRQLMNKTDGICQQQFLPVIQCQIPCCRIKGSKKFVLLKNTGTCQSVQKCGLTGIGITLSLIHI